MSGKKYTRQKELGRVKKYIKHYQDKLGLQDITIIPYVVGEAEGFKYFGEVMNKEPLYNVYYILIQEGQTAKCLKDTILHELLHILLWRCLDTPLSLIKAHTDNTAILRRVGAIVDDREHEVIEKILPLLL